MAAVLAEMAGEDSAVVVLAEKVEKVEKVEKAAKEVVVTVETVVTVVTAVEAETVGLVDLEAVVMVAVVVVVDSGVPAAAEEAMAEVMVAVAKVVVPRTSRGNTCRSFDTDLKTSTQLQPLQKCSLFVGKVKAMCSKIESGPSTSTSRSEDLIANSSQGSPDKHRSPK